MNDGNKEKMVLKPREFGREITNANTASSQGSSGSLASKGSNGALSNVNQVTDAI